MLLFLAACLSSEAPEPLTDTAADTGVDYDAPTTASRTSAPRATIHPEAWDFGEVGLDCAAVATFTLENLGDAPLAVSEVSLMGYTGDFAVDEDEISGVPAESRAELHVRYRPTDAYADEAWLRVLTDDPVEDELLVPLTGDAGGEPCGG